VAPLRDVDPFGLYHVMSRGNFRQRVFRDEEHYLRGLHYLDQASRRYAWIVLDWVFMPNHYHLVVQLTNGGLSAGMRELNGCFSRWSNSRTGRTGTGHLWQNRFRALDIAAERHFWAVFRYLPINPVAGDLTPLPDEWRWSGFRATMGIDFPYRFHQPAELLRYFAAEPEVARERYRAHVDEGLLLGGHATWSDREWSAASAPRG
jgi:REP element-mobilizing transposase RayT